MFVFAEFGSVRVFSPARFLQRGSDGRLRRLGGDAEGEMLTLTVEVKLAGRERLALQC